MTDAVVLSTRRQAPPAAQRASRVVQDVAYRLFGERLDRRERRALHDRLKQADLHVSAGLYRGLQALAAATAAGVGLPLFSALFWVLGAAQWSLLGVGVALVFAGMTVVAFPFALSSRIAKRRDMIEKELPFSLSEFSVLASIGLSPIQLVRRMAARDRDPAMTNEFRKIVYKTSMQGQDIVTALAETARESPSALLRNAFWDLGNIIHQGGDIAAYIQGQAEAIMETKRARQKAFIDRLGGYADMYVTVVLLGIIFMGIGAFLMDAFGTTAGGLGADAVLKVMAYGVMPVVVLVLGLLLHTAYGRTE